MWLASSPATYPVVGGIDDGAEIPFSGGKIYGTGGVYLWREKHCRYVWHPVRQCSGCGAEVFVGPTVQCPLCGALDSPPG